MAIIAMASTEGQIMYDQWAIDGQADVLLQGVAEGEPLQFDQVVLLQFALRAGASALDVAGAEQWMQRGLAAGVTPEAFHEIITLMSAIGVHVFFESTRALAAATGVDTRSELLVGERRELWDRWIGNRPYWASMREEIPGFLEALVHLDPQVFEAFLVFVGVPFQSRHVSTVTKEIISMAADACPSHQYLPGMRMHLRNAVQMGAGKRAIRQALEVASTTPTHVGVL